MHGVDDTGAVSIKIKFQVNRFNQMRRFTVIIAEDCFCHLCSLNVGAATHRGRFQSNGFLAIVDKSERTCCAQSNCVTL